MILFLQAVENPLDVLNYDLTKELKQSFPDEEILALDNHSEEWLVRNVAEQSLLENDIKIILIREGEVDFKNLHPIINRLPQMKGAKMLFQGEETAFIKKLKHLKNLSIQSINKNEEVAQHLINLKDQ